MSTSQFFPKLSQNYIELLEDNEHYNITIEVGEDPNVKIFPSYFNPRITIFSGIIWKGEIF